MVIFRDLWLSSRCFPFLIQGRHLDINQISLSLDARFCSVEYIDVMMSEEDVAN